MTEEIKHEENYDNKCFCQNKSFRKFLVIALGTFVGAYAALSLFAALHKPPMMPPCPMGYGARVPMAAPCPFKHKPMHFNKHFKGDKGHFQNGAKDQYKGPAPFDNAREQDD